MNLDEIISATGGPVQVPAQPDGSSVVVPLNGGGLDKTAAEAAPTVDPGAGVPDNVLAPRPGEPADGSVMVGGFAPDSSAGPEQLPASTGVGALTPDPSHGRPEGGPDNQPAATEGAARDPRLGPDQTGQGIAPMLKPANAPRWSGGIFGKPGL